MKIEYINKQQGDKLNLSEGWHIFYDNGKHYAGPYSSETAAVASLEPPAYEPDVR